MWDGNVWVPHPRFFRPKASATMIQSCGYYGETFSGNSLTHPPSNFKTGVHRSIPDDLIKTLMVTTILALLITLVAQPAHPQTQTATSAAVEDHIRDIIRELPPDSALRRNLLQGARGNGVHYSWMDEMRQQGIKRAVVWIDISFDHNGRPKKMSLNRTEYFAQYEGGMPLSDNTRLSAIRATSLEKELTTLSLERARHGSWVDVPRPKPHPFIGGTRVEFLDDEWLPGLPGAGYYAGTGRPQIDR